MGIFINIVKIVPLIVAAVQAVEALLPNKHGKDKQDAALNMVKSLLPLIEEFVGKDLLDDAQVQLAVRSAIDAIVALQNTVDAVKKAKNHVVAPVASPVVPS